ncbi:MAG: N-6 DNA methylase [Spirochaetaceae bacterium]|nr:N-6 DNA methylase [Spirochaetaceae bacterium]
MLVGLAREESRAAAHAYERALLPGRRKRLGQYFTGLPLGRLLAHLALLPETRTVLDPMAGHGDLLDATWEAATQRGISLLRLDGVEVDALAAKVCRRRLAQIAGVEPTPMRSIVAGDAFVPATMAALPQGTYDLVITNPPYVRYQVGSKNGAGGVAIRAGLSTTLAAAQSGEDASVWRVLAKSYSGLADLSVPAWLLAAAMVRPGGRLALVVPATWRSREYADVVRYLLLRCFELQCIVSDRQPGWFSDALVRTHLIVAQRLTAPDAARSLGQRTGWPTPPSVEIAPPAAGEGSLVGALAGSSEPEADFAARLYSGSLRQASGVSTSRFDLAHEAAAIEQRANRRPWFRRLEARTADLPLFADTRNVRATTVPDVLADLLPRNIPADALSNLADAGIAVGQGLRTGCNGFFYVTARGPTRHGEILIEASPLFGRHLFAVPATTLRPVLRRQAEVAEVEAGRLPDSRVLDLRTWALLEDMDTVLAARSLYGVAGEPQPEVMPPALASYVQAAMATCPRGTSSGKPIPSLSAVRTNARPARDGRMPPRFWYMLPDFVPRHLPAVFVPRVNHQVPRAVPNLDPPLVVDANFSTFWMPRGGWTRHAVTALLNSAWCRAVMEALGTPLGGGALKLEAAQLRNMPIPILTDAMKAELDVVGKGLSDATSGADARIDGIVLAALGTRISLSIPESALAVALHKRAASLAASRRRDA